MSKFTNGNQYYTRNNTFLNNLLPSTRRHAADHLKVNEFVDLTNDNRCFVCDKLLSHSYYSLANAITYSSKSYIAQKLGELVGKRFLVVVSEDDYICQECVNLFNRLDNIEIELRNVKTNIMKKLEHTYIGPDKTPNVLPGHMYKSLQILLNNEQEDDNEEPPQKKKCLENKNILQNCVFQQNQYIKSEKTIKSCQELTSQSTSTKFKRNKENKVEYQENVINHHCIKIEHQNGRAVVEQNLKLINTKSSIYKEDTNSVHQTIHSHSMWYPDTNLLPPLTAGDSLQLSHPITYFSDNETS